MYWRLTPAVAVPCSSWPVSSSAPTASSFRRHRRAASSRPATACLLTWLIASISSHDARLSSRWVRSGVRSPACSATDHPFRDGSSLAIAFTYFPACCHVCVRAKHDLSPLIRADRSRNATRAPILAGAAAFDSFVLTNIRSSGGCARPAQEAVNVRVQVGDIRIFFETYGAEWVLDGDRMRRRPVVLALHGGPGADATGLRCALAPLAGIAQLVVPDQRGHGRSDRGTPATWNLARWAADVRELCEVTSLQAPVVLGRSFGGFVAQQYAAAYPQHPSGLILMAT